MNPEFAKSFDKIKIYPLGFQEAKLSFSRRLQRDQFGWSKDYTERVIDEYRKFFFLLCISEDPLSPSDDVDQVWHLHLLYTQNYRDWCLKFNEKFVDHGPTQGGKKQRKHLGNLYQNTLDKYREVFLQEPPSDIWPSAENRFKSSAQVCWVDLSKHYVISYKRLEYLKYFAILLILTGMINFALNQFLNH